MITITLNGEVFQLKPGVTLLGLIENFKLNPAVIVVERNGNIIERGTYSHVELLEGDNVELVHFVGGG